MKKVRLPLIVVLCLMSCPLMTPASQVVNVSTRSLVEAGDSVMIGGFIITGSGPRTVVVRAIGPSLTAAGVPNALSDPTLKVHDSSSTLATNDNWKTTEIGGRITADQVAALQNSGLAPTKETESAVIVTLQPGNYTAIVSGKNASSGVGLVEVYDISPTQHLYLGNNRSPGEVRQYDLPINPTSTPNFSFAANNVVTVAADGSGNIVVGEYGGNLLFFTAPLSGSSTPSASFKNGTAPSTGQVAFTNTGDLFASTFTGGVNKFTHPFSDATTPSATITNAELTSTNGIALDFAQNLYISNEGSGSSNLFVFAPPYTGAPIITPALSGAAYRSVTVSATQLFVCAVDGSGRVDVYDLPITSASAPAFAITAGVDIPEAVALDFAGNLHVGNLGNATVTVYAPPFSASTTPTTTLSVTPSPFVIFGLCIGK